MIHLALCNDLSAVGRCSIAVQLPVLSALGIEASPLPTAVLSSHTGFSGAEAEGLSDFFQKSLKALVPDRYHLFLVELGQNTGHVFESPVALLH